MDEKMKLAEKYGIDVSTLKIDLESVSVEELTQKFEQMQQADAEKEKFELLRNITEEICRALGEEKIEREWGEYERYCYIDCDVDAQEVYCWDREDWLMYGLPYEKSGDSVVIHYEQKRRKKYAIVDFVEGEEQPSPFEEVYALVCEAYREAAENADTYNSMLDEKAQRYAALESEAVELRKFKSDIESAQEQAARESIFKRFEKLDGIEAFEDLKANCEGLTPEQIEEKCFAIKGRMDVSFGQDVKFAMAPAAPKLPVDKAADSGKETEPYGDLFVKYGL